MGRARTAMFAALAVPNSPELGAGFGEDAGGPRAEAPDRVVSLGGS
jgi:hypothetical protein